MLTEEKLSKLLHELFDVKDELLDCKTLLKSYKIESERLSELKKMLKEVREQVKEEKQRIESDFMEDDDYRDAKERETKLKLRAKELTGQTQVMASTMKSDKPLTIFKVNVGGMDTEVAIESLAKVHVNGKELR